MLRYRDSGTGGNEVCPGAWFDDHVIGGIRAFRGQFGFFRYGAISKYETILKKLAEAGSPVNLVLGSNVTDPLTIDDVESVLKITTAGEASHLTVIALHGALFHPKVAHIVQADDSEAAIIGSANLTVAAFGANVEAWIEVASGTPESDRALRDIVRATDWWLTSTDPGVFQITNTEDARKLLADGIVVDRATRQRRGATTRRAAGAATGRGGRRRRWTAPPGAAGETMEREGEVAEPPVPAGTPSAIVLRWCKKLSASDALQTGAGTNPTGKLRLGQAGHNIDQNTWFRQQLFGGQNWTTVARGAKNYEEAHVAFNVRFPRRNFDRQNLLVDHAAHREAGQHNIVTVLSWGPTLGRWLRDHSQTGKWVIIELDDRGEYWLRIQSAAPTWAPAGARRRRR